MAGGILQLVAKGVEDLYINGNPMISNFKIMFRRHSEFSLCDREILSRNGTGYNFSSKATFRIERLGDLLHKTYILVEIPEIELKRNLPTFKYIYDLLKSYNIIWNYSPNDSRDLVKLEDYNSSIIIAINNDISKYITLYNFTSSLYEITSDPIYLYNHNISSFMNFEDNTYGNGTNTINTLSQYITTGRNIEMTLLKLLLSQYITEYSSTPILQYLPQNNIYNFNGKEIMLYSNKFKSTIFNYGILSGFLYNYSLDCLIYNAYSIDTSMNIIQDQALNNLDSFLSIPIFNNAIQRKYNSVDDTIDRSIILMFKLYDSDDLLAINFLTYLNNIIRIKIVNTVQSFDINYINLVRTTEMGFSDNYISELNPDILTIDDSMLFYYSVFTDSYSTSDIKDKIGTSTTAYFMENFKWIYELINKYNDIFTNQWIDYKLTDAYIIFIKYLYDIIEQDQFNKTIRSKNQIDMILQILLSNIDYNIRTNFEQIINIMKILYNASRTHDEHYIISFIKTFSLSGDNYYSQSNNYTSIIGDPALSIEDNIDNILNNLSNYIDNSQYGILVKNFFNEYIRTRIKTFVLDCNSHLRINNYDSYTTNSELLEQILFDTNNDITEIYNDIITTYTRPSLDPNIYGKLSYMNYIPFRVVKDIPRLIYDTYNLYASSIFIQIGADTTTDHTNFDNFMIEIDYRDTNDDISVSTNIVKKNIKTALYLKMIDNIICYYDTLSTTYKIEDEEYITNLVSNYTSSNDYITGCSLKPSSMMSKYAQIVVNMDNSINLNDISSDPNELVWLPIEWITQTYYFYFKELYENYIDNLTITNDNKTLGKNLIVGILENIINCFIVHNVIPDYNSYKNNNYNLLGLIPETNSTINQVKNYFDESKLTSNKYCDAISSIWFQTQRNHIQSFNNLYNDTLLSSNYYYNNLGSICGNIFDNTKTQILSTGTNTYYDESTPYPNKYTDMNNRITDTIKNTNSDINELYPPVLTEGFDIYRLKDLDTKKELINTYITDSSKLYDLTKSQFDKQNSILKLITDTLILFYYSGSQKPFVSKIRYKYETSQNINSYIDSNVRIKYIDNSNLDTQTKTILYNLVNNSKTYWTNNIKTILDFIYNDTLTGSITNILNNIDTIPVGKTQFDLIDNINNPFDSYFLHNYYLELSQLNRFTYGDMIQIKDLLNKVLFNSDLSHKITPETIYLNKNLSKLYSYNNKVFYDASCVSYYIFDLIIESIPFETNLYLKLESFGLFIGNNNENYNSFITRINKLMEYISSQSITYFKTISKFGPNAELDKITYYDINNNSFLFNPIYDLTYNYIDINNKMIINDIIYYIESLDGEYKIYTTLEKRLLDLINRTKPKFAWVKELGHKIFDKQELLIGDQPFGTHDPDLLHMISKIYNNPNHKRGYDKMIGNIPDMYKMSSQTKRSITKLYIPVYRWWCKDAGNALPLINFLYIEVFMNLFINSIDNVLIKDDDTYFSKIPKLKLSILGQYIYLAEEERIRISQSKLEYLIEDFNSNGAVYFDRTSLDINNDTTLEELNYILNPTIDLRLRIEDPIKYLIWTIKIYDKTTLTDLDKINWTTYGYNVRVNDNIKIIDPMILSQGIKFNDDYREQPHLEKYFTNLIPYKTQISNSLSRGQYMYSFSLYPLMYQPSGAANFSEIDTVRITIRLINEVILELLKDKNIIVEINAWGLSYNILRVLSGMAGKAFFK